MRSNSLYFRWLGQRLPTTSQRRIMVMTGARQTGKTTLARLVYPDLRYVNLDDLEVRDALGATRAAAWGRTVGDAILDEAQKEPSCFEKVKYAFDEESISFTSLLGSSRILLLRQVQETLAGRAFVYDLWPLMLSELLSGGGGPPPRPLLDLLLRDDATVEEILKDQPEALLGGEAEGRLSALEHLAQWGGMPGLLPLSDEDRRVWLRSYRQTYLERDLMDLVRLSDLHPFRSLQELAMLRTGNLLSYSELARDAGISPSTARRYVEYLDISYQILLLRPYVRNLTSRVVKAPKLYWLDLGLLRHGTAQWGPLTGEQFETLVVGECYKWISTSVSDAKMFFYRTRSGMEVDTLLESPHGILSLEVKNRREAHPSDARAMIELARSVGSRWRGGLVVYRGNRLYPIAEEHSIWAIPAQRLF